MPCLVSSRSINRAMPTVAGRLMVLLALVTAHSVSADETARPNVLFIAVDDLNHWVGHLKRNPQTVTPNLDRLASWGVSFANAYCAAPACNPSRTALMSGMRPSTTGVYHNPNDYRPHVLPDQTLNSWFRAHGYRVMGAGKIYHGGGGRLSEWDEYAPRGKTVNQGAYSRKAIGSLIWSQLKGGDDVVNDYHTVSYCIDKLGAAHDQPFFLACGIFRPHLPWSVPRKYFEMHPLDRIELPPYRDDDLADVPPQGIKTARPDGDHRNIQQAGAWKEAIQAYLASISYADAQLGRLLDAFEQSAHRGNTIIVLWGDHGWHLGEKQHWRKFALWEEATRAPLIWVVPGVTPQGQICRRTVDFMGIFPTLCDLAGLKRPDHVEGPSLRPLLAAPDAAWDRPAITTHGFRSHAVRTEQWRYIRYENGDEELYDEIADPYEWKNLAGDARYAEAKSQLSRWFPEVNVPEVGRKTTP